MLRLLSLLAILLYSPAHAGLSDTTGWHESYLIHEDQKRYFRYFVPQQLPQDPDIVMVFHGGTQSMRKIFRDRAGGSQEWQQLAEQHGFLLIAPNGVNVKTGDTEGDRQNWNDCRLGVEGDNSSSKADDVGFVARLIDWAREIGGNDKGRVFVTGASNGGMMSLRLVSELNDRIAAAAVFIANQPQESDCHPPTGSVPLLMMMATDDPLMPWQGGQIRGKGPSMMSAHETRDYWLKINAADPGAVSVTAIDDKESGDDSTITRYIYPAKGSGNPLWFYEIRGAGHTMPSIKHDVPFIARILVGSQNKDIEATHEAWSFFDRMGR